MAWTRSTRLVGMPAASTTVRVLVASVIASLTVTGCQTLDDAGQVIDRADLVNDLATRLDRALELDYSADYQLSGGRTASIAQSTDPPRSVYTYPGGWITVSGATAQHIAASGLHLTHPGAQQQTVGDRLRRGEATRMLTARGDQPADLRGPRPGRGNRRATPRWPHHAPASTSARLAAPRSRLRDHRGVLGAHRQVDGKPVELTLTSYRGWSGRSRPADRCGVVDRRPTRRDSPADRRPAAAPGAGLDHRRTALR
jgi:hypothetical protein